MGLLIIVLSNVFLVQENSSEYDYAIYSITKLFKDKLIISVNLLLLVATLIIIYTPIKNVLKLTSLSIMNIVVVIIISFVSVFWYELVKIFKKNYKKNRKIS